MSAFSLNSPTGYVAALSVIVVSLAASSVGLGWSRSNVKLIFREISIFWAKWYAN